VQVRGEGSVGVGIGVDGAIIIIVLGNRDPLGSGELQFQVMGIGLLLLPSEGGGALVHLGLIQGIACNSHSDDESMLLLLHGKCGDLSHDVILFPLSGTDGSVLVVNEDVGGVAQHGRQDNGG
jgi:hypothetical protein